MCVSAERVDAKPPAGVSGDTVLAHVPARLRGAGGEEADDVRHVAAADEQSAAIDGVADERGDPAHRLRLDLGGGRRQRPRAHVGVHRRGEKIAENPDRRRWRGDVAEKTRVAVEQRVLEEQLRRPFQQRPRLHPRFRKRPRQVQRAAHRRRRFVAGHRSVRQRLEEIRQLIHEPMAQRAERGPVHRQRRMPNGIAIHAGVPCW